MQSVITRYILIFFLSIFVSNTVISLVKNSNENKSFCIEQEEDGPEDFTKKNDQKKVQLKSLTMPFDDDICHEFHFNYYFRYIKHLRYQSPVPALLDATVQQLYSPPKA